MGLYHFDTDTPVVTPTNAVAGTNGKEKWYNEWFQDKPIWAVAVSASSGSQTTHPYLEIMGSKSMHPLFSTNGSNISNQNRILPRVFSTSDNAGPAGHSGWGYDSSSQMTSSSISVGAGRFPGTHSNSAFSYMMNLYSDGHCTFPNHSNGAALHTQSRQGIVIGEEGYVNGISLTRNTNYLSVHRKDQLWDREYDMHPDLDTVVTLSAVNGNQLSPETAFGQVCYNRRADALLIVETVGNNTMRFCWYTDLAEKIRPNDGGHLKGLLDAATKTTQDITMPTSSSTTMWRSKNQVVLCDDLSVWIFSQINGGNSYLWRIHGELGSMVAETKYGYGTSNGYGLDNTSYNPTSFLVSEDQKYVCLFYHYYYYGPGINAYFVSTESTDTDWHRFQYGDSSNRTSIAPYGGSDFVLCYQGNHDSQLNLYHIPVHPNLSENLSIFHKSNNTTFMSNISTSYGASILLPVHAIWTESTEFKEMQESV